MGIITRAEATHRLKLITAKLNCANTAVRDGNWKEGASEANEAWELLSGILPHLDEAADESPVPVRVGGMGYRGNHNHHEEEPVGSLKYGTPPAAPFRVLDYAPPEPIANLPKPIVTPPRPQPIITPPPATQLPEPESAVFDLSRIAGREEYVKAAFTGAPSLTDEEWVITELFDKLPQSLQDKITEQYAATGKPVTVRLKESK